MQAPSTSRVSLIKSGGRGDREIELRLGMIRLTPRILRFFVPSFLKILRVCRGSLAAQQLPQHVLEDAAVLVVQQLLRGVDADSDLEFPRVVALLRADRDELAVDEVCRHCRLQSNNIE